MKKTTLQLLVYLRSYLSASISHVQQSEAARHQIERSDHNAWFFPPILLIAQS